MTDEPTEQSSAALMVQGLSVKDEPKQSPLDRFGPLIAVIVYVACIFLLAFEIVPNPGGIVALLGLFGPFIGAWATKLAVK